MHLQNVTNPVEFCTRPTLKCFLCKYLFCINNDFNHHGQKLPAQWSLFPVLTETKHAVLSEHTLKTPGSFCLMQKEIKLKYFMSQMITSFYHRNEIMH